MMLCALLLQAVFVVLLRCRLGKLWLRRPVTIVVLASVVYQGVSPVLLSFPAIRAWDIYRQGVAQSYADSATLLLSAAILAFTIAYLLTRPERTQPPEADPRAVARGLDWRLQALCCLPLAYLTYEGRGYNNAVATGLSTPLSSGLASTFFVILVALTAFSLLLRIGSRWFLPVLAAQSVLLAAAGERAPVIADAVVLIVLLCHAGLRPPTRQLQAAGALTLLTVLAITGARTEQGRSLYYRDSGFGARVSALAGGLAVAGPQGSPGLLPEAAVRLDGIDFTAAILQSESLGQARLSPAEIPESLLLAVPSALWPSKLGHAAALNPDLAQTQALGLQRVNFLPGLPGLYAGFLSPPWLIALLAFLGVLAGWGERWLLRASSPARLAMVASALTAALAYERGLPGMLLDLRTGAVLALGAWGLAVARERSRKPTYVPKYPIGTIENR